MIAIPTSLIPYLFLLPFVGAAIAPALGRFRPHFTAGVFLLVLLPLAILLAQVVSTGPIHLSYPWAPAQKLNYELYLDSLALLFSTVTIFLCFLSTLHSAGYMAGREGQSRFYSILLLFGGGMLGMFCSANLFQFLIFWELMTLSCYLLVGHFRTEVSLRAAMKYFIMIHVGTLCLLAAFLSIYFHPGIGTLSMVELSRRGGLAAISPGRWLLPVGALSLVGFGFKAAMSPFHTWLPEAHPAPSPISALLSGIMIKAGIYGMLRFLLGVYGLGPSLLEWAGLLVATFGVVTMVIGVHMAFLEKDIKRILAFHSVSQIGYMILGIGVGTTLGITGALFHALNHALFKACLFLCAGSVIYRVGTRNIDEMGGLAKDMPLTTLAFLFAAFAISGIPPFNGFASKLIIYEACLSTSNFSSIYTLYAAIAIYVSALTVASFMKAAHSIFFGQKSKRFGRIEEVPIHMVIPTSVLSGLCLLFGIFPLLPMKVISPAVESVGVSPLEIGWLGYTTSTGVYLSAVLAAAVGASILLGLAIYRAGLSFAPAVSSPQKYEMVIGGESADILGEELRPHSDVFSGSAEHFFDPLLRVARRGGFDLFWVGVARGVASGARGMHRRLLKGGYVPVLLLVLMLGALLLLFVFLSPYVTV